MIGVQLTIDASDVKQWVTKSQQVMKTAQRDMLSGIGRDFEHQLQDEAGDITVSSGLYNSISSNMVGANKNEVKAINYAEIAMETGRKPGTPPPVSQLKRWARLKLGDERLAYVVARSIGQKGTRLYREKRPKRILRAFKSVLKNDIPKRMVYFLNAITE